MVNRRACIWHWSLKEASGLLSYQIMNWKIGDLQTIVNYGQI